MMICGMGLVLTGCFDDDDSKAEKYKVWRERNERYVDSVKNVKEADGSYYYTLIEPDWAPSAYSLVHWHNDRALTQNNLSPMDNSTVEMTYELFDIDGNRISDSFSNPDSVYRCMPSQNIVGVWAPLTRMNVGDSVTIVLPSQSGYGEMNYGGITPYSTLIYNIKLKAITAYEVQ